MNSTERFWAVPRRAALVLLLAAALFCTGLSGCRPDDPEPPVTGSDPGIETADTTGTETDEPGETTTADTASQVSKSFGGGDWSAWPAKSTIPRSERPSWTEPADTSPLAGKVIVLDPGHGGIDAGAVYPDRAGSQIQEKDINLAVAEAAFAELENMGATVYMTRVDDSFIGLYERIGMANMFLVEIWSNELSAAGRDTAWLAPIVAGLEPMLEIKSDEWDSGGRGMAQGMGVSYEMRQLLDMGRYSPDVLFLSIHCNSIEHSQEYMRGLEVYIATTDSVSEAELETVRTATDDPDVEPFNPSYQYYDDKTRIRLAECLLDAVAEGTALEPSDPEAALRPGNYAVLRETGLTSAMLELGYMTYPDDLDALVDPEVQQQLGAGIARGVYQFYAD